MFRARPFSFASTIRASLSNRCTGVQRSHLKTQTATIVRVASVQASNPNHPYAKRTRHRHPTTLKTGQRTHDFDFVFAEDDGDEDVCWSFEIMEGEDLMGRLQAYAQAFGNHGSGDDHYDEYVRAFQCEITGLCTNELLKKHGYVMRPEGEYEVWFKPAEPPKRPTPVRRSPSRRYIEHSTRRTKIEALSATTRHPSYRRKKRRDGEREPRTSNSITTSEVKPQPLEELKPAENVLEKDRVDKNGNGAKKDKKGK
ncbi:MAG: hypothetical protein HETSPECPRED_002501 [Heterodermia speciosa]|uniref:Uncharacterized protein n=1 Tax=Heterodermia speciosa TaxID=116794 RepID=A0A8H3EZH9_9LECA|nr:MAG: hypothetical protein HETSPECPRED_002501 [Heterodermia speciosa]